MDDEGPLVPEESSGLSEVYTLVNRALADEVVEEVLALGADVTCRKRLRGSRIRASPLDA